MIIFGRFFGVFAVTFIMFDRDTFDHIKAKVKVKCWNLKPETVISEAKRYLAVNTENFVFAPVPAKITY